MKNFFSTLFFILAITVNSQTIETLSLEEQLEDIEFIKTELKKLHPGIYTYQSKEEFENGFSTLNAGLLENQTVFEFYNSLVPVINEVGCGHTTSKIP